MHGAGSLLGCEEEPGLGPRTLPSSGRHRAHRPRGAGSSPLRVEHGGGQGPGAQSFPRSRVRIRPRNPPCSSPGKRLPPRGSRGDFVPNHTGRDLFVSRCRFLQPLLYFRFLARGGGAQRAYDDRAGPAAATGAAGPVRGRLGSVVSGTGSAPRGRPAAPGWRSARLCPLDRIPKLPPPSEVSGARLLLPPPRQTGPQTCPGCGAGPGAARAPHRGSAPRAHRPHRVPDPNLRPRRGSAPLPRGDPHPAVSERRTSGSPGHSPWKSESLGTSIPARIQCSSGKEPATAAFRCSAPGGGRWGMPV